MGTGGLNLGIEEEDVPSRFDPTREARVRLEQEAQRTAEEAESGGVRQTLGRAGQAIKQNPLSSLGLLAGNVSAGLQGRPLPSDQLRQERAEQRKFAREQAIAEIEVLNNALASIRELPERQQKKFAGQLANGIRDTFPKAAEILADVDLTFGQQEGIAAALVDPVLAEMAASSPDLVADLVQNPAFTKRRRETLIVQQGPEARIKAQDLAIKTGVANFREFEGLNSQLPKTDPNRLTGLEMKIIRWDISLVNDFLPDIKPLEAPKAPLVSIAGEETAFGKGLSEDILAFRKERITRGEQAFEQQQKLQEMAKLIGSVETQTGSLQPAVTAVQGIADDLGLNLDNVAKRLNIDLGSLTDKQEFNRLSKSVIIDGFEKFKGNLNSREVQIAEDAFPNLGRAEQSNVDAIASMMALNEFFRQQASRFTRATTREEAARLQSQFFEQDHIPTLQGLREKFKAQIGDRDAGTTGLPEGVPENSIPLPDRDGKRVFQAPDGEIFIEE